MSTFPTFIDWLRQNRDWLHDEWEDDGEPFDAAEFRQWARLQYDNEKMQHDMLQNPIR